MGAESPVTKDKVVRENRMIAAVFGLMGIAMLAMSLATVGPNVDPQDWAFTGFVYLLAAFAFLPMVKRPTAAIGIICVAFLVGIAGLPFSTNNPYRPLVAMIVSIVVFLSQRERLKAAAAPST